MELECRFSPADTLVAQYGLDQLDHLDRAREFEAKPTLEIPTIGAEIEVSWESVLPDYDEWFHEPYVSFSDQKKAAFDSYLAKFDWMIGRQYKNTESYGLPADKDAFHEFAHNPVNWHETLTTEVATLMNVGLIPEHRELAMHITIGGVTFDPDAAIMASMIELLGGTTQQRIVRPSAENLSWARAGISGIKQRRSEELQGRFSTGIEVRTLAADRIDQIEDTFRNTQMLATCLRAYQQQLSPELAAEWVMLKQEMVENILKPHDLYGWWADPVQAIDEWQRFADLIGAPVSVQFAQKAEQVMANAENYCAALLTK